MGGAVQILKARCSPIAALTGALVLLLSASCAGPSPVETIQTYLRMLSGERQVNESAILSITTENYRSTTHQQVQSAAEANREWILERADELRQNPSTSAFLACLSWATQYNVMHQDESSSEVMARVILTERRPGDREKALAMTGVPEPLVEAFRRGVELPFHFTLVKEGNKWKIDQITFPDVLAPLFETTEVQTMQQAAEPAQP